MDDKRTQVMNAFQPGAAMEIPDKFAGRQRVISEIADELHANGTCPMIYGDRGVGKSSIASQVERIALGDVTLLARLNLEHKALGPNSRFVTFYLPCTDDIKTKDELLQRVINLAKGCRTQSDLPSYSPDGHTVERRVNLKVYEAKVTDAYKARDRLAEFESLSIEEKFQECIECVARSENRRVLLIIDEMDRIKSTRGLASLVKSTSGATLKFMFVGVGHDVSAMLEDHHSLDRTLAPYEVRRMKDKELDGIITLVENTLSGLGVNVRYTDEARELLVKSAGGFPWFVHILGQETLLAAFDQGRPLVETVHVRESIASLAKNRYSRQFGTMYLKAVGNSPNREVVMRLFAKWSDGDVPTSEIYPIAHALGVRNPSIYVRELTSARCGRILVKAPFVTGHYSFSNAMFKRYVLLRSSVYHKVRDRVDTAWSSRRSEITSV